MRPFQVLLRNCTPGTPDEITKEFDVDHKDTWRLVNHKHRVLLVSPKEGIRTFTAGRGGIGLEHQKEDDSRPRGHALSSS